jgi:hypothetical protein
LTAKKCLKNSETEDDFEETNKSDDVNRRKEDKRRFKKIKLIEFQNVSKSNVSLAVVRFQKL